jgi:hypothetical protein
MNVHRKLTIPDVGFVIDIFHLQVYQEYLVM